MIFSKVNNVNDNVNFQRKSNNDNVNDIDREKYKSKIRKKEVDRIADRVCQKMGSIESREFYCKAAWKLPQSVIWNCVELALSKGKNPARYLTFLLNIELKK